MKTATHPPFCATKLPWHAHPFRLISWWDMNDFSAQAFVDIGAFFERVSVLTECDEAARTEIADACLHIALKLYEIGCLTSAKAVTRLHDHIVEPDYLKTEDIFPRATEIRHHIADEMGEHLFLWVPPERAKDYVQEEPYFGEDVSNAFSSSKYDIEESGKCLACNRSTAAVYHSMRILESGLTALGAKIGLPRGDRGWGPDLKDFKTRWRKIASKEIAFQIEGGPDIWDQFFSEAFTDFRHFAGAWRNDCIHSPVTKYTEGEAAHILLHVKSFMMHLATRLHE